MKEHIVWFLRKFTLRNLSCRARMIMEGIRGLDFTSTLEPEEVGLDPQLFHRCSPSGNKYLVNLLNDIGPNEQDAILDIGAGKGSAMYTMLSFPFERVDGIEISERIADIAKRNFVRLKASRAHVYQADARAFEHYARYNIFYFYNPFPLQVMLQVIDAIRQASMAADKEVLIIYNNPSCHDLIVADGVFTMHREYPDEWGNRIFVYSNRVIEHSRLAKA